MIQPNDTEYVLLREKQTTSSMRAKISIIKNNPGLDLSNYTFLAPKPGCENDMDRYVHNDDYTYYAKLLGIA